MRCGCLGFRVRVLQVGVVEFDSREDLKAAIRDLDGETPPSVHNTH